MAKDDKKGKKKLHKELENKVHQDLLVRNMPRHKKPKGLGGVSQVKSQPQFHSQESSQSKNNFKAVGFVIIFVGIIFVIGLVYLGYSYIIKPGVSTPTEQAAIPAETETPVIPEVITPTTPPVQTPVVDNDIITPVEPEVADIVHDEIVVEEEEYKIPVLLLDSDNDGLNNEEEMVLRTNISLSDSDSDGYGDLAELNNAYDPNGPGLLIDSASITKYTNSAVGYEMLYPTDWKLNSLNNGYTIIFTTSDNSIIQVSVQDNSNIQNIIAWYENSFPDSTVTYDLLRNNDNWDGVMGPDGLNFYLTDKDRKNIYVISYIPAIDDQLTYPIIFELMINSLIIQ